MSAADSGQGPSTSLRIETSGHVIMVDDNPGDIVLAQLGYDESRLTNEWMSFGGGRAFLAYMQDVRGGAAEMPAIVLLDLNMPDLTGFDVLANVREDPYFTDLPIFCMLTSSRRPRDRTDATQLGASGFVVKPDGLDGYVSFFNGLAP